MKTRSARLALTLVLAFCFARSSGLVRADGGAGVAVPAGADAVASRALADLIQQGKLTAADGLTNDQLGVSMAVSGNTLVVGAPYAPSYTARGAVYVFTKPAGGTWANATQAKLTVSDGQDGDQLGLDVAIEGDTIVALAPGDSLPDHSAVGSGYVFTKPAGGWVDATETTHLIASDGAGQPNPDQFGNSIDISGDTIVVGVPGDDGPSFDSGSVYVFTKPAGGWPPERNETLKFQVPEYPLFGMSVAIEGDTIVAGGLNHSGFNAYQGTVHVYTRPSGGAWTSATHVARLTASDGADNDQLGIAVDIDGDTIVAGARYGGNGTNGAVYVFTKPVGGWVDATQSAKLKSDLLPSKTMGTSVAISGDTIVAGAPEVDCGSSSVCGAALVFTKPAGGPWVDVAFDSDPSLQPAILTASPQQNYSFFGNSVAVSGGMIFVGHPGADAAPNYAVGSVYLFGDDAPPPPPTDTDSDGIPDDQDNCPTVANADQADADNDEIGNACDADYDPTAPAVTPNVIGTLDSNGWYTSDVSVTWSVIDNESTVSSTTGCNPTNITTDTAGMTLTCSATSAGGTTTESVTIKRHATATPATHIVFSGCTNNPSDCHLWVVQDDSGGANKVPITDSAETLAGSHSDLAYSPDATRIAFTRRVYDSGGAYLGDGIFAMDADGANETQITIPYSYYVPDVDRTHVSQDVEPSWSPDGTKIVFRRYLRGHEKNYLLAVDLTTPSPHTETTLYSPPTAHYGAYDPDWSPNGDAIAFGYSVDNGFGGIALIAPDGTNFRTFAADYGSQPEWSPDGSQIAYRRILPTQGIAVVNADGSNPHLIQQDPSSGGQRFPLQTPRWSPDGLRIAVSYPSSSFSFLAVMDAGDGANFGNFVIINSMNIGTFDWEPAAPTPPPGDSTPPAITPTVTGVQGNNSWYVGDVGVTWSVVDNESAVSSTTGCEATSITTDTAGVTFTCEATSAGGTTTESVTIKRDTTAPSSSAGASPSANAAGWRNTNVTVTFTGADGLSGLAGCDAPVVLSTNGVNQSASGRCYDNAGNQSVLATATGINIDKTPPTAVAGAAPKANALGWWKANLTVTFKGTDALSGLASCDPSIVVSSEGSNQSASGRCYDRAGNQSALATFSGINIDKSNPTISVVSPAPNAKYDRNQSVIASYSCNDLVSGVAACVGSVANGAALDTSRRAPNAKLTVTATDKAGNSVKVTVTYSVK